MKFKATVVIRSNGSYSRTARIHSNALLMMRNGTINFDTFRALRKIGNRLAWTSKTRE